MCNSFYVKEREEPYFKNKLNMYWLFRSVPSSDERRGLDWESTLAARRKVQTSLLRSRQNILKLTLEMLAKIKECCIGLLRS